MQVSASLDAQFHYRALERRQREKVETNNTAQRSFAIVVRLIALESSTRRHDKL
jgi:hypothetical protein